MADNGNDEAAAQSIDHETFSKRIKSMYSHWNELRNDMWGGSEAFFIATPPPPSDIFSRLRKRLYLNLSKSSALNMWLLGYQFPETITVFTKKQIHFLCSQEERASMLQALAKPARDDVGVEVVVHVKEGWYDDGSLLMDDMIEALRGCDNPILGHIAGELYGYGEPPIFGHIDREDHLVVVWGEKLRNANFQLRDVTNGLSDLFAVKDSIEIGHVRKAAALTSSGVERFVLPKLREMIEYKRAENPSELSHATTYAIVDEGARWLDDDVKVHMCYRPIFEGWGESYHDESCYVRPGYRSVTAYALGCRYKGYCSNVGRTLLVCPSSQQRKAYDVLLKAHEAAIDALQPGYRAGDVYLAAVRVVENEGPEFAPYLTRSAGSGMGLEFSDPSLVLNGENERMLRSGMVWNVSLGFKHLETEESYYYSLLVADTVIVGETGAEVETYTCAKAAEDVSFIVEEGPYKGQERIRPVGEMVDDLDRQDSVNRKDKKKKSRVRDPDRLARKRKPPANTKKKLIRAGKEADRLDRKKKSKIER